MPTTAGDLSRATRDRCHASASHEVRSHARAVSSPARILVMHVLARRLFTIPKTIVLRLDPRSGNLWGSRANGVVGHGIWGRHTNSSLADLMRRCQLSGSWNRGSSPDWSSILQGWRNANGRSQTASCTSSPVIRAEGGSPKLVVLAVHAQYHRSQQMAHTRSRTVEDDR